MRLALLLCLAVPIAASPNSSSGPANVPLQFTANMTWFGKGVNLTAECDSKVTCGILKIVMADKRAFGLWVQLNQSLMNEFSCVYEGMQNTTNCSKILAQRLGFYHRTHGKLCIRPPFVKRHPRVPDGQCALMCDTTPKCQAFSTADAQCRLFLFDKCSRNILKSNCRERGVVYVKKRPGLQPGTLCPTSYGSDFNGMKYRLNFRPGNSWSWARAQCETDNGLVTMADIADVAEMNHVASMMNPMETIKRSVLVDGYQTPGSAEPAGGWHWATCKSPVDSSLWAAGEPNNYQKFEDVLELVVSSPRTYFGLNDLNHAWMRNYTFNGFLCKCVSPF